MTTATRETCSRFTGWRPHPSGFGNTPIRCHQSVGLVSWQDSAGNTVRACSKHRASLERRYPAVTESEGRLMGGDR